MSAKIKTVLFSTLYPSSVRPLHGIFVETRLRELLKTGEVETRVIAPVPWFPFKHAAFGEYAQMAATPLMAERNGVQVHHPRYLLPPKIGQNIAPYVLAAGALPTFRRLITEGFDFDLIDSHFVYPDGVAASIIARKLGKPFVCTARGSDITLYRQFDKPRSLITKTLRQSRGNIGVCADLVEQMIELGARREDSHALRNGVDLKRFTVIDQQQARQHLGLRPKGLLLVSVGHLIERKGHDLVIRMLTEFPDAYLVIIGSGPKHDELQSLVAELSLGSRVHFAGQQPNETLKYWFSAADALVLASSKEGWANVLLESMACGTPVVATRVNGTPEVVTSAVAGQMASVRDVPHLCGALRALLTNYPDRAEVRRYAEDFSWEDTSAAQVRIFSAIKAQPR